MGPLHLSLPTAQTNAACQSQAVLSEGDALHNAHAADAAIWQKPEQWQRFVSDLSGSSQLSPAQTLCVLVCGSKNTGKSSLARLLVNALLSKHGTVAFLDTDCGQPELTPPGGHLCMCLQTCLCV